MSSALIFALVSVIIYLVGNIPYLFGILKKEVTPHPFSFGVWSILTGVNLVTLLNTDSGWGILPAIVEFGFVLAWTIFGTIGIRRISINAFDYVCLALGGLTLLVWFLLPVEYATMATIVVEIVAFLPSVKKGWIDPRSETVLPWVTSGLFPIFLLFSMSSHSFANAGFWLFIAMTNSSFALMIFIRTRMLQEEKMA